MWSGTVPLTSVYGKSVSTPALPRASIASVIRRVNRDAGGSMKAVCSWACLLSPPGNECLFIPRPCLSLSLSLSPTSSKHAAVVSAWERLPSWILAVFFFWHSLTVEKQQPHGAQLTSRGRLTGAVARLCVERCRPSRERCPIFVPGLKVCKDNFTSLCVLDECLRRLFPYHRSKAGR